MCYFIINFLIVLDVLCLTNFHWCGGRRGGHSLQSFIFIAVQSNSQEFFLKKKNSLY